MCARWLTSKEQEDISHELSDFQQIIPDDFKELLFNLTKDYFEQTLKNPQSLNMKELAKSATKSFVKQMCIIACTPKEPIYFNYYENYNVSYDYDPKMNVDMFYEHYPIFYEITAPLGSGGCYMDCDLLMKKFTKNT
jgi:hypothetical protein